MTDEFSNTEHDDHAPLYTVSVITEGALDYETDYDDYDAADAAYLAAVAEHGKTSDVALYDNFENQNKRAHWVKPASFCDAVATETETVVPAGEEPAAYALILLETDNQTGVVESKRYRDFGDLADDFALYVEIYGDDSVVLGIDDSDAVPAYILASYPTLRAACNTPHKLTPTPGMKATLCHLNDRYGGQVIATAKNGREVSFVTGSLLGGDLSDPDVFTLRKDGSYRLKGNESPYLVLGAAENYRAREI